MSLPAPVRTGRRVAYALGAVALGASLAAARPYVAPLAAGFSYTFRVSNTTTDHKGKTKSDTPMIAKVQVAGDKARLDIQETKGAAAGVGKSGGFMVTDRKARTISMADPDEKTFTTMPIDAWTEMTTALTAGMGQMMNVKISEPTFRTEDLGDGGLVNGLPTRKYRVTHDYKMDMKMAFIKQNTTNHSVAEYWVNEELRNHPNPLFEMMGAVASGFMANDTVFSKQVKTAMQKMFVGVPVKSVTTTESVNQKGEKTVTVSTMEMAEFRRGDVPASAFAAPAGYTTKVITEQDLAKAREDAKRQQDSARVARDREAAEEGAEEAAAEDGESADAKKDAKATDAKSAAKDAAKKKLRGVFGKP